MFEKLSNVDTNLSRLTNRVIVLGSLTFALFYILTPIVSWSIFAEGATSTRVVNLTIMKVC
jgi:hypothetical protein